jgi:hypothetical protein
MRGAVQQQCVWTEAIFHGGRCTSKSLEKIKGLLCVHHAGQVIPKENPNYEFLVKAQASTIKLQSEIAAKHVKKKKEDEGYRLRRDAYNQQRRMATDYFKTPEEREIRKRRRELEAKAFREQLRAKHEEFVAEMKRLHPSDWQDRIGEPIMTDEQTEAVVDALEVTPLNQLKCAQVQQLLLSTIGDRVDTVVNGLNFMGYFGLAGPQVIHECPAPPGKGIQCGEVCAFAGIAVVRCDSLTMSMVGARHKSGVGTRAYQLEGPQRSLREELRRHDHDQRRLLLGASLHDRRIKRGTQECPLSSTKGYIVEHSEYRC